MITCAHSAEIRKKRQLTCFQLSFDPAVMVEIDVLGKNGGSFPTEPTTALPLAFLLKEFGNSSAAMADLVDLPKLVHMVSQK